MVQRIDNAEWTVSLAVRHIVCVDNRNSSASRGLNYQCVPERKIVAPLDCKGLYGRLGRIDHFSVIFAFIGGTTLRAALLYVQESGLASSRWVRCRGERQRRKLLRFDKHAKCYGRA